MTILEKFLQSKFMERTRRFLGTKTGIFLKLKRFTASASEDMRIAMLMNHMGIKYVIDIGANTGQFAESLYDFGYKGKVISFEPGDVAYQELLERSEKYPNWTVAEKCAIGAADGEIEINITDDSVFSSVLEIKDNFASDLPKAKIVRTEKVPIYAIDSIIDKYIDPSERNIVLKIDTQGYEKEVITGAAKTIKRVKGVDIEIPFYAIYENTKFTFYDIIDLMKKEGFQPYSINTEGVDLATGRVNTVDGLFFRE